LKTWINKAYSEGLVSVVSAGNTTTGGQPISSTPANVENAITVTALKQTYSSSGAMAYDESYSDYGSTVDFAAPGSSIKSAWIETEKMSAEESVNTISGTSMAAPHVTACVALLYLSPAYTNLSLEDLNTLLQENSDRTQIYKGNRYALTTATRNNYYGYGIINIKNIGIDVIGDVNFDVEDEMSDTSITLHLSYDKEVESGVTVEIRYTTDETAESASTSDSLYKSSLTISKTTKITAVAYIKQNGSLLYRSNVASKTYYIANKDLDSTFEVSNGVLKSYSGTKLSTLEIGETISGQTITTINTSAFSTCTTVKVLYLPSTVTKISQSAFESNKVLKEIYCDSDSLQIGNYAFQKCTSLETVEIPHITSLGQLSFAYSAVSEIVLDDVKTIGQNAFSASSLTEILIGKNIESIGTHTSMSLQLVRGYAGTAAEEFAEKYNADFFDLTLRITKDFASQKVIRNGSSI
jgi:hypothetical protein